MDKKDDLLYNAVKDCLERKGVLNEVKSRLRSEIYNSIEDCGGIRTVSNQTKEIFFINQLIREYLIFHNFKYTASVFETEGGLMDVPVQRDVLETQLKDDHFPVDRSLLQSIVKVNQRLPKS
ncbi:hypothetical protein CHUAL_007938 [Chamberlinius hualienensis]